MSKRFTLATAVASLAVTSAPVMAAGGHAHEHGVANLTVVQSDNLVQMNLLSPMANLVGFEGAADTPERKAALEEMKSKLDLPLLAVKGCTLTDLDADYPGGEGHDEHGEHHDHDHADHHDEEHDHDDDDHHDGHDEDDHPHHDEEHDHADHHDEEHDHEGHDHDEEHDHEEREHMHSDLEANWTFECQSGADLLLNSQLFEYFPGISTLKVQWITDAGQGAATWQEDRQLQLK